MNWVRAALIGCTIVTAACIPTVRGLVLRSDARLLGGTETTAKVEVPGSWLQQANAPDRAEWLAPDNFSKVVFTLAPVTVDPARCPELARRAVEDSAARIAEKQITPAPGAPDTVDFELQDPGPVPGPSERIILGRAMCRNGGLVQVSCSTGHLKTETIELCRQVIASVTLEGVPAPIAAPAAPAPTSTPSSM